MNKPDKKQIKKKKAEVELKRIKRQIDSLIKQVYLRGKIDGLEGVSIEVDK